MAEPVALSAQKDKFIDALLIGASVGAACQTAGISPRTAARWRKNPGILAELAARRKAQFNETLDAFRAGLPSAIALVLETIRDKSIHRSIRLKAAEIWINKAFDVHRAEELEARLTELEDLVHDLQH